MIIFDTETRLFKDGYKAPKPVCLAWESPGSGYDFDILVGLKEIEEWFHAVADSTEVFIGHNVAYDFAVIYEHIPSTRKAIWNLYKTDRVICTEINERLLDIAEGCPPQKYSLEALSSKKWGVNLDKENSWRLRYSELEKVPLNEWPEDAKTYVKDDVRYTAALVQDQADRGLALPTAFEDARASWALHLMSAWGILTDQVQVKKMWQQVRSEMLAHVPELEAAGLACPTNKKKIDHSLRFEPLPSVKVSQKAQRAEVERTYPGIAPTTKKGAIKTDEKTIKKCDSPSLRALHAFKSAQKTASTFIKKLHAPIVHSRFKAVGAGTDRTSSSGPNLQQQSKMPGVRECFIARPGCVLISCDYDTQEMRTLAQSHLDLFGRSSLAEKFQADPNYDPHLEFGAKLAQIDFAEAQRLLKEGDPDIKAFRQRAKAANFGFPGGLGTGAFISYAEGYGVHLTPLEAKALRDEWMIQVPEMHAYFQNASSLAGHERNGTIVIPRSGFTRAGVGYTQIANGYFQTLAAHASKAAAFNTSYECYGVPESPLYGARPVVFIHDELILECKEDRASDAAKRLEKVMEESMSRWTPDIPVRASACLMRRWSKAAKAVFDDQGTLIPWEAKA